MLTIGRRVVGTSVVRAYAGVSLATVAALHGIVILPVYERWLRMALRPGGV